MSKLEFLADALEYIEQHLQEDLHTEDIATACFCSKSTIEKLFRQINHISVRDYVTRRRMTKAARTLVEHPEMGLLEVAVAGEEDILFRIGGDEFVLLTNSEDEIYAKSLADQILQSNGKRIEFEGRSIPLSLYAGIVKLEKKSVRYSEMFTELHSVILQAKREVDPTNLA